MSFNLDKQNSKINKKRTDNVDDLSPETLDLGEISETKREAENVFFKVQEKMSELLMKRELSRREKLLTQEELEALKKEWQQLISREMFLAAKAGYYSKTVGFEKMERWDALVSLTRDYTRLSKSEEFPGALEYNLLRVDDIYNIPEISEKTAEILSKSGFHPEQVEQVLSFAEKNAHYLRVKKILEGIANQLKNSLRENPNEIEAKVQLLEIQDYFKRYELPDKISKPQKGKELKMLIYQSESFTQFLQLIQEAIDTGEKILVDYFVKDLSSKDLLEPNIENPLLSLESSPGDVYKTLLNVEDNIKNSQAPFEIKRDVLITIEKSKLFEESELLAYSPLAKEFSEKEKKRIISKILKNEGSFLKEKIEEITKMPFQELAIPDQTESTELSFRVLSSELDRFEQEFNHLRFTGRLQKNEILSIENTIEDTRKNLLLVGTFLEMPLKKINELGWQNALKMRLIFSNDAQEKLNLVREKLIDLQNKIKFYKSKSSAGSETEENISQTMPENSKEEVESYESKDFARTEVEENISQTALENFEKEKLFKKREIFLKYSKFRKFAPFVLAASMLMLRDSLNPEKISNQILIERKQKENEEQKQKQQSNPEKSHKKEEKKEKKEVEKKVSQQLKNSVEKIQKENLQELSKELTKESKSKRPFKKAEQKDSSRKNKQEKEKNKPKNLRRELLKKEQFRHNPDVASSSEMEKLKEVVVAEYTPIESVFRYPSSHFFIQGITKDFNPQTGEWEIDTYYKKYTNDHSKEKLEKEKISYRFTPGERLVDVPLPLGAEIDISSLPKDVEVYKGVAGNFRFVIPESLIGKPLEFKLWVEKDFGDILSLDQEEDFSRVPEGLRPLSIEIEGIINTYKKATNQEKLMALFKIAGIISEEIKYLDFDKMVSLRNEYFSEHPNATTRDFVIDERVGDCDLKNQEVVLAARRLGLPAVLAIGFNENGQDTNNDNWGEITKAEGHAVSLVYDGKKWVVIDATGVMLPSRDRNGLSCSLPFNDKKVFRRFIPETSAIPPELENQLLSAVQGERVLSSELLEKLSFEQKKAAFNVMKESFESILFSLKNDPSFVGDARPLAIASTLAHNMALITESVDSLKNEFKEEIESLVLSNESQKTLRDAFFNSKYRSFPDGSTYPLNSQTLGDVASELLNAIYSSENVLEKKEYNSSIGLVDDLHSHFKERFWEDIDMLTLFKKQDSFTEHLASLFLDDMDKLAPEQKKKLLISLLSNNGRHLMMFYTPELRKAVWQTVMESDISQWFSRDSVYSKMVKHLNDPAFKDFYTSTILHGEYDANESKIVDALLLLDNQMSFMAEEESTMSDKDREFYLRRNEKLIDIELYLSKENSEFAQDIKRAVKKQFSEFVNTFQYVGFSDIVSPLENMAPEINQETRQFLREKLSSVLNSMVEEVPEIAKRVFSQERDILKEIDVSKEFAYYDFYNQDEQQRLKSILPEGFNPERSLSKIVKEVIQEIEKEIQDRIDQMAQKNEITLEQELLIKKAFADFWEKERSNFGLRLFYAFMPIFTMNESWQGIVNQAIVISQESGKTLQALSFLVERYGALFRNIPDTGGESKDLENVFVPDCLKNTPERKREALKNIEKLTSSLTEQEKRASLEGIVSGLNIGEIKNMRELNFYLGLVNLFRNSLSKESLTQVEKNLNKTLLDIYEKSKSFQEESSSEDLLESVLEAYKSALIEVMPDSNVFEVNSERLPDVDKITNEALSEIARRKESLRDIDSDLLYKILSIEKSIKQLEEISSKSKYEKVSLDSLILRAESLVGEIKIARELFSREEFEENQESELLGKLEHELRYLLRKIETLSQKSEAQTKKWQNLSDLLRDNNLENLLKTH